MEYLLYAIFVIIGLGLVVFRKDFMANHESILHDWFFMTLIIGTLLIALVLCLPLWASNSFLFTSDGYEYFLEEFSLPRDLVGLTALIATAYGFHHTSKKKEHETKILRCSIELQTATTQMSEVGRQVTSAGAITILLIKITNNVEILGRRLVNKIPFTTSSLKHDINIIDGFWNGLYQDEKYLPVITGLNSHLQSIDMHIKGVIELAQGVVDKIETNQLQINTDSDWWFELGKKFDALVILFKKFEDDVVIINKHARQKHEQWRLYTEELRAQIRND